MEQQHSVSTPIPWRHLLWLALLVAASVAFSLGFACAVPLAAFAAAAALTLSRADALVLILLVWLANQFVGFSVLGYPWTLGTFAWGVVWAPSRSSRHWSANGPPYAWRKRLAPSAIPWLSWLAFAVYEAALFVVSATLLGGTEVFTGEIQGRILAINAAAFVGLLVLNRLAISIGLVARPPVAIALTERPA